MTIEAIEELEEQNWASQDRYDILGRCVAVRSTSREIAAQVRRLFRSFQASSGDSQSPDLALSIIAAPPPQSPTIKALHSVYRNDLLVGGATSRWQLFRLLEWQLDAFLAEEVTNHYLLHAGAVSRDGVGIILPGSSGSGKSSITMGLLLQGYSYMSDEIAVVEPSTGKLHPFPKPLSIKDTALFPDLAKRRDIWLGPEVGEKVHEEPVWYVHPEDVKPDSIGEPVPIHFIIFPKYDPGGTPGLHPLSPSEAMRGLINNSVNATRFGRDGLHVLAGVIENAECFALTTNSLDTATALVNELVSR